MRVSGSATNKDSSVQKSGYQEKKEKDSLISKIMKISIAMFVFLALINLTMMYFLQ